MRLGIRASDIKDWFQYRCERKLIYATISREDRDALPVELIEEPSLRAEEGTQFESEVIKWLRGRGHTILEPSPADGGNLHPALFAAFLRGERPERFAYQANLVETAHLRLDLALPETVSIRTGRPDLLEWVEDDAGRRLRVIEIKHTRRPTQPHRAQVALYALMLRGMLVGLGQSPDSIDPEGVIWHIGDDLGQPWSDARGRFGLPSREEILRDLFRRRIGRIAATPMGPGRDESFFHLYFKCEQCSWLPHCGKSIAHGLPPETWDLSAVPGMSHQSKRALVDRGIRTVGALAERGCSGLSTWTLRTRGRLVQGRAKALVRGTWERLPEHHTWLMPPRLDVPIFLVVDRDPVAGHLTTLGCLIGGVRAREPIVEVVTGLAAELAAIKKVLGALVAELQALDQHNQTASDATGLRAHIFVYEPSEAADLRDALAGHLDDPGIRDGLLHLIRLFPPDEVPAPEPEYRGAHHLPASALRSVMEQLYVLPAKVSYDLARVGRALARSARPPADPYTPQPDFARPFSARLSIDVMRRLGGRLDLVASTRADVVARLRAMAGLCAWVQADNAEAEQPFLRLRKAPFRFQEQFHPLDAIDLDVLVAQELLQSRAERLAALVELARPWHERRERMRCYARLELDSNQTRRANGGRILSFGVPPESQQAEIAPGRIGLILTDDDPDLRMDPAQWDLCNVRLRAGRRTDRIEVWVHPRVWKGPVMQRLIRETPPDGWFLDQAHADVNTPRIEAFLRYLSEGVV